MAKLLLQKLPFVFFTSLIFSGYIAQSVPYDYSASIECLAEPLKPQYGGGIILNADFNRGIHGWSTFGYGNIEERTSRTGNKYLAFTRSGGIPYQSVSQKVLLQKDILYTFSAWLQTKGGLADVVAIFKTGGKFIHAGAIEAKAGCWSMLKGGLTVDDTGSAELYFESNSTATEIWVDNVSLQPFTAEEWRSHQTQTIKQARMKLVRLKAVDANGTILPNTTISIKLQRPRFPFGCAIAQPILTNNAYQNWFTSRFTVTTFENEMKWYSTEKLQGKEDYYTADAMVNFAKQHRIAVRGHNIFWDDPRYQMGWVTSLSYYQLKYATAKRLNSIVFRYRGQLIAWDVVNENLHFNFFEQRMGQGFSGDAIMQAGNIDPGTFMFLNDYNTLEQPGDTASTPDKYLQKFWEIQTYTRSRVKMAIGLEAHFSQPNIPFIRAALDKLARANAPIWLTEVDVFQNPYQAQYLEAILREAFSYPAVQGVVMWAGWHPEGCNRMCLTDNNFRNLPTGDVVDKLLREWRFNEVVGTTDKNGVFEAQLFHGEHEIKVLQSHGGHITVDEAETVSHGDSNSYVVIV